ncbi:MAG TPA: hypothetical protein VFP65_12250 [Anaeromyxobacteraceae bacterium]|nr:hypothetical protein [Anaeromyxobacteraceae bacterium]
MSGGRAMRRGAAALFAAALAACGSSLYDGRGVPQAALSCDPLLAQVACHALDACVAEDDRHCGPECADCTGSSFADATPFCDRSAPDPAQHACSYRCHGGFERDPGGPGCRPALCAAPRVQCGTACFEEGAARCGPRCLDCTASPDPLPANASPACLGAAGQGACGFACAPGFLKSNGACVRIAPGVGSVALGAGHTCVLGDAGGVLCWGANASGQLGVGDTADRLAPVYVPLAGGAVAVSVSAGASHTCAVTAAGTLQCWGSNASAQLGLPTSVASSLVPAEVPALAGVEQVAAGAAHTCAVLAGGAVSCWGANDKGQVGASPAASPLVPAPARVSLPGPVSALATQADHTCAIVAATGAVACWGANSQGQAGQSVSPNAPAVPGALVSSLTATALVAGGAHTCALGVYNAAAGVYCWGDRSLGQTGNGTAGFSSTPLAAASLAPASGAADLLLAGRAHTCLGRTADGSIVCGGADGSLQVGAAPGATGLARGPTLGVPGALEALVGGGDRGCARSGGALFCWGANEHGQLGDGTTTDRAAPVLPRPF